MEGFLVLIVWGGVWYGFAQKMRKAGKSKWVAHIGGFFVGLVASGIAGAMLAPSRVSGENSRDILIQGILVFGAWAGIWYAFAWKMRKENKSAVIAHGGGFLAGAVAAIFLITLFSPKTSTTTSASAPEKPAFNATECIKDLSCWADHHHIEATIQCEKLIVRMAKYDYQWTDKFLEPKLSHFRWKNSKKGYVTYIGDKIKFQNGFGAWQNSVYECDFDPTSKQVLDIRAKPGRLPPS